MLRPFYIGKHEIWPPFLLAPMAGETGSVLRRLCKREGAGLVCTELTSSYGLFYGNEKTQRFLIWQEEERPISAQIFGADPHIMADACRRVADAGADMIDINMGCWVPKVAKTGAGAALLKNLPLARELMTASVQAVDIPITIKTRVGWDGQDGALVELARSAEDVGVQAIAVHGRTARQGFGGEADWGPIGETKAAVSIPVIGNGDIRSAVDAKRMFRETGCDAVMIGRHALGNPWIFRELNEALLHGRESPQPSALERLEMCREHARLTAAQDHGASSPDAPLPRYVRGQLSHYLHGLPSAAAGRKDICQVETLADAYRALDKMAAAIESYAPRIEGGAEAIKRQTALVGASSSSLPPQSGYV